MSEAPDFYDRLAAGLALASGKQVGYARVPAEGEISGRPKLEMPYAVMNPIMETEQESSMEEHWDSADLVVQIVCVGSTPKQTRWMSNRIFDAIMSKGEGGAYEHTLLPDSDRLEWRLCDQRGAILPTGPNLFNQQDNYRLRRGA